MITGILKGSPITGAISGSPITGTLYDGLPDGFTRQVVTGTASSVSVPDGAYGARFVSLGSEAEVTKYQPKWAQFNQLWSFGSTTSQARGITYSLLSSGTTYKITGTATGDQSTLSTVNSTAPANHKLLVTGIPDGASSKTYGFRFHTGSTYTVYKDGIYSYSADVRYFRIFIYGSYTVNLQWSPQVFDLTAMFGEGNEPTMEEFKKLFPLGPYAYDAGTDSTSEVVPVSDSFIPVCGGTFSFYDSSEAAAETTYTIEFIGRFSE